MDYFIYGTKMVRKSWKGLIKGIKDGSWNKWYENGQKEIESSFQNGKEEDWLLNGMKMD